MAEYFRRQGVVRPREGRVIARVCAAWGGASERHGRQPGTEADSMGRLG